MCVYQLVNLYFNISAMPSSSLHCWLMFLRDLPLCDPVNSSTMTLFGTWNEKYSKSIFFLPFLSESTEDHPQLRENKCHNKELASPDLTGDSSNRCLQQECFLTHFDGIVLDPSHIPASRFLKFWGALCHVYMAEHWPCSLQCVALVAPAVTNTPTHCAQY